MIVGFSASKHWYAIFSSIIKSVENRPFSHAFIGFKLNDIDMVAQASHGYVNLVSLEQFKKDNDIVKQYQIECMDFNLVLSFILKNLGKPYSYTQLVLIAIKKLLQFEVKSYNKDKYFICSEFAAMICKLNNIDIPSNLDYVTPSDLEGILAGVYK